MRKIALVLTSLMLFAVVACAQKQPKMEFNKDVHNFGTIQEKIGSVTTQFKFKNSGDAPLIIQRVSSSCGCTTPQYTRKPILPGKEGTIDVRYSAKGRPGTFNKRVTVFTNIPDTVFVLRIKGTVIREK